MDTRDCESLQRSRTILNCRLQSGLKCLHDAEFSDKEKSRLIQTISHSLRRMTGEDASSSTGEDAFLCGLVPLMGEPLQQAATVDDVTKNGVVVGDIWHHVVRDTIVIAAEITNDGRWNVCDVTLLPVMDTDSYTSHCTLVRIINGRYCNIPHHCVASTDDAVLELLASHSQGIKRKKTSVVEDTLNEPNVLQPSQNACVLAVINLPYFTSAKLTCDLHLQFSLMPAELRSNDAGKKQDSSISCGSLTISYAEITDALSKAFLWQSEQLLTFQEADRLLACLNCAQQHIDVVVRSLNTNLSNISAMLASLGLVQHPVFKLFYRQGCETSIRVFIGSVRRHKVAMTIFAWTKQQISLLLVSFYDKFPDDICILEPPAERKMPSADADGSRVLKSSEQQVSDDSKSLCSSKSSENYAMDITTFGPKLKAEQKQNFTDTSKS